MTTIVAVVVIGLVVALIRGGRFQRDLSFRDAWLAPLALALQVVSLLFPGTPANHALVFISYLMLILLLARNFRFQSLRVVMLGVLLNFIAIAANGGRIPTDVEASRRVGLDVTSLVAGTDFKHIPIDANSVLPFLGDVIAVPSPVGKVISIGDLAILAGVFLLVQDLMGKQVRLGFGPGE